MAEDATSPDNVKKHPIVFYLTTIVVAFAAGFTAHSTLSQTAMFGASATDWQTTAKDKGWISKAECPAMPVSIRITGPGDGATFPLEGHFVEPGIVINASYPIPKTMSVGIVYNIEGESNFSLDFPGWPEPLEYPAGETRTTFRKYDELIDVHTTGKPQTINLWAIATSDASSLGQVYGSLDQIKAASPNIIFSPKITIKATPQQ